jgi:Na+-translocating ferredoxin:NAD+ oxidoreductase RnfG subunit
LSIDDIALRREGGQIDAITGATISSGAVVDAVRTTTMEKVKSLKEGNKNG